MVDRCVCCEEIIPEGRQVCINCESRESSEALPACNSRKKVKNKKRLGIISVLLVIASILLVGLLAHMDARAEGNTIYRYQVNTEKEIIEVLRKVALKRQEDVVLKLGKKLWDADIDYKLYPGFKHVKGNWNDGMEACNSIRSVSYVSIPGTVSLTYKYYDTYQETRYVDRKVNSLYKKLKLNRGSKQKKAKRIYDYIIKNFSYDYTYQSYTAYDMLTTGKGVCYSFASLYYKLCIRAGISCVIVKGTANGQYHGWNYVRIGGRWKLVDATFGKNGGGKKYFLAATPKTHRMFSKPFEEYIDVCKHAHTKFYREKIT